MSLSRKKHQINAYRLFIEQDYQGAIYELNEVMQLKKTSDIIFMKSFCHRELGELREWGYANDVAINLNPDYPWVEYNCILINIRHTHYQNALNDIDTFLANSPELAYAGNLLKEQINRVIKLKKQAEERSALERNSDQPSERQDKQVTDGLKTINITEEQTTMLRQVIKPDVEKHLSEEIKRLQAQIDMQTAELKQQNQTIDYFKTKIEELSARDDIYIENKKLLRAARDGNIEKMERALKDGADIETKDASGHSALYLSLLHKHFNLAELLLGKRANLSALIRDNDNIVDLICQKNDLETVKYILEYLPKNDADAEVLLCARELSESEEIKQIIADAILFYAVKAGNQNLTDIALKKGVDAKLLISAHDLAVAKEIKQAIADAILFQAAKQGNLNLIEIALQKGANINAKEEASGHTALYLSILHNHLDPKLLINKNPALSALTEENENILRRMCKIGDLDAVKFILKYLPRDDADAKLLLSVHDLQVTKEMKQAIADAILLQASKHGNITLANVALNKGANINTQDSWGMTALHEASSNGHRELVTLLLNAGCCITITNTNNQTAEQVTPETFQEIKTLISDHAYKAASTIQADFRGMMQRKKMPALKESYQKEIQQSSADLFSSLAREGKFVEISRIVTLIEKNDLYGANVLIKSHHSPQETHTISTSSHSFTASIGQSEVAVLNESKEVESDQVANVQFKAGLQYS